MNRFTILGQGCLITSWLLYGCRVLSSQPSLKADFYHIPHATPLAINGQRMYIRDAGDIHEFVLRTPIGTEYQGVVVDAGVAVLYDARIFNIGLAIGPDYLTDANRQAWLYQQKPWFGVLFGLSLN